MEELNQSETLVVPPAPEVTPPVEAPQKHVRVSKSTVVRMITDSVKKGEISRSQAQQLRKQMGIAASYFTKPQTSKEKAKAARKRAEVSRRRNRGLGKGQKRSSGKLGKYT